MFNTKRFFVLSAFILFLSTSAFALPGASIGLMGGANLATPSGTTATGNVGYAVGPTLTAGPLEVSALYTHYSVSFSNVTATSKYLDIPVLYRMGVGLANVGVGGFYGIPLDTGNSGNYGLVASTQVNLLGKLFLDGRYNLGLKNSSGSKLSSAALLVGFNFL